MGKFSLNYNYITYCIVLYLDICKALLTVIPNQKHSQCEELCEKRNVLRQREEAEIPPVRITDRIVEGRSFQSIGPTALPLQWSRSTEYPRTGNDLRFSGVISFVYLWCYVVWCAAESSSALVTDDRFLAHTKVGKFNVAVRVEQDVV